MRAHTMRAQCHWNYDANCNREECFGCDDCPAPDKWWDRSNNYHDRSCLIWGIHQERDTWNNVRLTAYCSIERPVCGGRDCARAPRRTLHHTSLAR